ncbi:MAG TPA: DUF1579 family protein [Blastocatellia bacterium]|nr:DUF1579 family protein [Blastocatellia bacterium]
MNLTEIQHNLMGDWDGANLLQSPNLADSLSTSHLCVKPVVKRKFLIFTYTWSHDGSPQEGFILLGYNKEQGIATAAWADSWHMSAMILPCQGAIDQHGVITLNGSYKAPTGRYRDWRITIRTDSVRELHITIRNLTPEGAEELAVRANYRRVS